MSDVATVDRPTPATAVPDISRPSGSGGASASQHALLRLQRTAGNAAVTALLTVAADRGHVPLVLQRQAPPEEALGLCRRYLEGRQDEATQRAIEEALRELFESGDRAGLSRLRRWVVRSTTDPFLRRSTWRWYRRLWGQGGGEASGPAQPGPAASSTPAPAQAPPAASGGAPDADAEADGTVSDAGTSPEATGAPAPPAASAGEWPGRPWPPRVGQSVRGFVVQQEQRAGRMQTFAQSPSGRKYWFRSYGGNRGVMYVGGDNSVTAAARERVAASYAGRGRPGDAYRAAAARGMEIAGHEGNHSAVNTYDSMKLTLGTGFAGRRVTSWLQRLRGTPAGEALSGLPYIGGLRFDGSDEVRLDLPAIERILDVIESPSVASEVARAQVEDFVELSALGSGSDMGTADAVAGRVDPAVIGVASYLHHGMPGYTPDPVADVRRAAQASADPSVQVAHVIQQHVRRLQRARGATSTLAARTVVARVPNKIRQFREVHGSFDHQAAAAVAPALAEVPLRPAAGPLPTDGSRVVLVSDGRYYDFGS